MDRKKMAWLAGSALAGGGLAVVGNWGNAVGDGLGLAAPLWLVGKGLRALSLSGFWGNLAAWVLVLAVCALPRAGLGLLRRRGRGWKGADWLLVLMVPQLFALLYYLVNPTRLAHISELGELTVQFFPIAAGGTLLSTLLAWLALEVLGTLEGAPAERLAGAFRTLLWGCAFLQAFGAGWEGMAGLLSQWASVREANTGLSGSVRLTLGVLAILALLELAPALLSALTLAWGGELAGALGRRVFDQELVDLCGRTAEACRRVVRAMVALTVAANLLQMSLFPVLHSSSFSAVFPLFSLALSLGLLLLCRCLQRGKELQEDSDSII